MSDLPSNIKQFCVQFQNKSIIFYLVFLCFYIFFRPVTPKIELKGDFNSKLNMASTLACTVSCCELTSAVELPP